MGPFPNNKFGSVAYLIKNGKGISPVLSVQFGKYKTCKEAVYELEEIVKTVRELDLTTQAEELEELFDLGEEDEETGHDSYFYT